MSQLMFQLGYANYDKRRILHILKIIESFIETMVGKERNSYVAFGRVLTITYNYHLLSMAIIEY